MDRIPDSLWPLLLLLLIIFVAVIIIRWLMARFALPYVLNERFLTPAEKKFYFQLCNFVPEEFLICPKVRMADILAVEKGTKHYLSYFNRIAQKHVDFLICHAQSMEIVCAIELDDSSHQRKDRIKRDRFVDRAFQVAGLPIIHIPLASEYTEADFSTVLDFMRYYPS